MMKIKGNDMKEFEFYEKLKDWNFDKINYKTESLTDWELYSELKNVVNDSSVVLDLGTGGGEKVIKHFPKCKEIIATDFSPQMIITANKNLKESERRDIKFKVMDNLKMNVKNDYFDVVVARHTCIDANQIYEALKKGGKLLVRGVDKLDCWSLKMFFNSGAGFDENKSISQIDYENIINAGFKNVELIPIHVREYFETKEDLMKLLLKVPILSDFDLNKKIDIELLDKYILDNTSEKGILLLRRYYGIVAEKI